MVTLEHTLEDKKAAKQAWRDNYGYDVLKAILDLRCYRNCCRDVIGRGELFQDGIKVLIDKQLIIEIPQETTEKGHAVGIPMVQLTSRFRKIGRYLIARKWGVSA